MRRGRRPDGRRHRGPAHATPTAPPAHANPVDGTTGTPLGGFGAGAVKFDARTGTFAAITRPPADQTDYTRRGAYRFQLSASVGGKVVTSDRLTAAKRADGRSADDAIWPEHRVDFGTINGIGVRMTAFSPMDSTDQELMSMPYAFFDLHVTNDNDTTATVAPAPPPGCGGPRVGPQGHGVPALSGADPGERDGEGVVILLLL